MTNLYIYCIITSVKPIGLKLLSQLSAAGSGGAQTSSLLFTGNQNSPLTKRCIYEHCGETFVGVCDFENFEIPERLKSYRSRIAQIAMALMVDAEDELSSLLASYPPSRIGIVIGSSTSVVGAAEEAFICKEQNGSFPPSYSYDQQELGAISAFIGEYLGVTGPCYTVSTACSSGGKAFSSARDLIEAGFCDVVIAGGIDSVCRLTVGGFFALELISPQLSNPFSLNRSGLNIGEGGALFLVTKDANTPVLLRGIGEASDAYHISTPHPEAVGAIASISAALDDCSASSQEVAYMNLHGTGTLFNDLMESKAVNKVLGPDVPCSSTKPLTGHILGAAGAIELAFCYMALMEHCVPVHRFDNVTDHNLATIRLAAEPARLDSGKKIVLSSSFAFGGSNCCLAISAN